MKLESVNRLLASEVRFGAGQQLPYDIPPENDDHEFIDYIANEVAPSIRYQASALGKPWIRA